MPVSSSAPCWPYGGTSVRKSSMKRVPVTTVPAAPDGVIVTLTTAEAPGLMTIGENVVPGLVAASSRSPVDEVVAESKALAVADIDMLTVPAGAPDGYGPISLGVANQKPLVSRPPDGVYEPDGDVPMVLTRSGSP